jgi:hypothetical protein
MEPELWSVESVASLEAEVDAAEKRLASLTASIRATTVEIEAARDPAQFDPQTLGLWQPNDRNDPTPFVFIFSFLFGGLVGGCILQTLFFIVHRQGQ